MGRMRHLSDDQLYETYFAERSGESVPPPSAEHLADCPECAGRYRSTLDLLDSVRAAADDEVDAAFSPEQLRTQQANILRRIESVGRSAQVIAFPGRQGTGAPVSAHPIARRWVAAAAAAGLFVGLGTGYLLQSGTGWPYGGRATTTALARPVAAPASAPRAGVVQVLDPDEEAFMSELELAADRPRTRELMPFDALTPHVREVSTAPR